MAWKAARDASGTLFECGCLDVNFESRGAETDGRKREKGSSELEPQKGKWDCHASK